MKDVEAQPKRTLQQPWPMDFECLQAVPNLGSWRWPPANVTVERGQKRGADRSIGCSCQALLLRIRRLGSPSSAATVPFDSLHRQDPPPTIHPTLLPLPWRRKGEKGSVMFFQRRSCIQQERGVVGQSAWPDLPPELLGCIVAVLGPRDRVAVRLVCASWRACVRESFPSDLPFEAPRLLFRRPGAGGGLAFFSLHHRKVLPFALPASISIGLCCGQIGGWLAMALDDDRSMVLCNLVSGRSVAVPPPPMFPVSKVVLSGPPTSPGWVAAAVGRTGTIALLQPAVSGAWMTVGVDEGAQHGGFRDVALWSGRLCALGFDGAVLAFRGDLRARAAAVSLLREAEHPVGALMARWSRMFLVESDGELLLVRKLYVAPPNRPAVDVVVEVQVLLAARERKWGTMEETPGRAVFVGSVASAVVAVGLYPAAGLRESCVYLAQREVEMLAPHAICEYSLADEELTGVPISGGHSADVEPVWITPFV